MEKVIVLGLSGCRHCNALVEALKNSNILFEFRDADLKEHSALADRMESLLKVNNYPMAIIERGEGAKYFYLANTLDEAKEIPISFATKVGCVSTDSMVVAIKKYIK